MAKRIDPVDERVGQRVRNFRLSRGMSQTVLGKKIGVTFQQIQKYERGVNRMAGSRLKKAATVLDVPVAALFGENDGDETAGALPVNVRSQQHATRLLRAFGAIKDSKRRLVLVQLAESMAHESK